MAMKKKVEPKRIDAQSQRLTEQARAIKSGNTDSAKFATQRVKEIKQIIKQMQEGVTKSGGYAAPRGAGSYDLSRVRVSQSQMRGGNAKRLAEQKIKERTEAKKAAAAKAKRQGR